MSLHKVYCAVCFKDVKIKLAGRPHDFMDHLIQCPCKENEMVVIKNLTYYGRRNMSSFTKNHEYALISIIDLIPSVEIHQEILKAQGKKPMIVV
jgi:NAD-dependent SIR2 family protein deacetylase